MATEGDSYKVGLCMAGAITGGAYSAGVIDFFMEAMAAWDAAKLAGEDVPGWNISVPEIAGSSAGGITATLAVAQLNIPHQPLPRGYKFGDPSPSNNPLFETWVKEMHYTRMFDCRDIDSKPPAERTFASLLYGGFMTETSHKVLKDADLQPHFPAWASEMQLVLTATNMRGVPYSIKDFTATVQGHERFYMRRYVDYSTFQVTISPESVPDEVKRYAHVLNLAEQRDTPVWETAITCSRATSAFPGGFPSVTVKTPKSFYDERLGTSPDWVEDAGIGATQEEKNNPVYEYAAVDGGVVNNEPFGILGEHLENRYRKKLDTHAEYCWGSLIMIDPFPGVESDPFITEEGMPVSKMAGSLLKAIMGEAMFKEDEVREAGETDNMHKFMIKPQRKVAPGQKYVLATETLGAFGGMLDEKIRLHDFILGRKNCKDFLEKVFCISKEDAVKNPIFAPHVKHLNTDRIPIIPVVGKAAEEILVPEWPKLSEEERKELVANVLAVIKVRISKIIEILMRNIGVMKDAAWYDVSQKFMNQAASLVSGRIFLEVTNRVQNLLEAAVDLYQG